jgi:D-glycero-D-manno-heptose 1,7-bisphosphate phosphatase
LNLSSAVFLDRDGTLIEEKFYLSNPDHVALFPRAADALLSLQKAGYKLFIVSNQSGVGRGYFTMQDVERVNERMARHFAEKSVHFEKFYISPDVPDLPSRSRKPSPQFVFDARDEFGLDLASSFFIGDKLIDVECGWNAGVKKSILVRTGYGRQVEIEHPEISPKAVVVDDLAAAAKWILSSK